MTDDKNHTVIDLSENEELLLEKNEVASVHLTNEIFISVWNKEQSVGSVSLFAPPQDHLARWLSEKTATTALLTKAEKNSCIVKCLVPSRLKDEAEKTLSEISFAEVKVIGYDGPLEAFYFSENARLRIGQSSVTAVGTRKKRVLVVDDSKTIQTLLTQVLSADPDLEVVATAERPSQVEPLIKKHSPDVITLDIHMPEMDGVTLLGKLLPVYKIPTVMISALSMEDGDFVLRALELGAVDYVQKPTLAELDNVATVIREKVKTAAATKVDLTQRSEGLSRAKHVVFPADSLNTGNIICIGSSTGGTEAIRKMFLQLPAAIPPIVVVQHIPAVFSAAFAKRLNDLCPFEVKEAQDGDAIQCNRVLIAPGGFQMTVAKTPNGPVVRVLEGPPVNRHLPSVDVLFDSVAKTYKSRTIGIILTGMGADGAKGLLELKKMGARTIAEDESSCVVFGMPKAAIQLGAAEKVAPLDKIPATLVKLFAEKRKAAA